MTVFADYARYYNVLYKDKDYAAEVNFILQCLQNTGSTPGTLLDLGCGTGRHALEMAGKGIAVSGVDMSETMLAVGQEVIAHSGVSPLPELSHGDARNVRLHRQFDAVTSLFHVMSYQTTEAAALAVMHTAREHLVEGGLFLFDFWYGPGVLTDPPTLRRKIMEDEVTHVERSASPVHRINDNIVEVHYAIDLINKESGDKKHLEECHTMRYWFMPELRHLAYEAGLTVAAEGVWMSSACPDATTWNAWMMVRK